MSTNFRLLLIAGSLLFLGITLYYIFRKGMDLANSIRWFAGALILFLMALFPDAVGAVAGWVGIEVPSNLVFLIGIVYLLMTSLSLSAVISAQQNKIRTLTLEQAALEKEIRDLKETIENT